MRRQRSNRSGGLPAARGPSPNPALPYSETLSAYSLLDPGRVAKLLSRENRGHYMWHRWRIRSRRAAAMTSSCRISPQCSKPLFEVRTAEARP